MKILLGIISAFILLQTACKKPDYNDLAGTKAINGVAMLRDSRSSSPSYVRLKNITVYLRAGNNSNTYLYTVKTDNQGQFSFSGIDAEKSYTVDASYDSLLVRYTGSRNYAPPATVTNTRDTLLLDVDPLVQNGINLVVKDVFGGVIPNVNVWVFNSRALFEADTSAGAAFTMRTDPYGIDNRYVLAPGTYYFRVKTRSGNTELVDEKQVTIGNTGIETVNMTVRQIPLTGFGNGIDIAVTDGAGPVNNGTVFFYKNYSAYLQDSNRYVNSLFKLNTGPDGHAATYVINPATYFIWAIKILNTHDTLKSRNQYQRTVTNAIVPGNLTVN